MADQCEGCCAEDVKLYSFYEWQLCSECLRIEKENERINQQDAIKEDRRLEV